MEIFRHSEKDIIGTDLDPIEDLMNYILVMKSKGYATDILRDVHGFTISSEIKAASKLISLHISTFEGLANQALSSPNNTSYLSFYYACLNLIKVNLLLDGKRSQLQSNRHHGATYRESEMHKLFLNEKIKIINRGTINLAYSTISTTPIPKSGLTIRLEDIYKFISSVSAEYKAITGKHQPFLPCKIEIIEDNINGHFLKVNLIAKKEMDNPPRSNTLKAFSGIKLNRKDPKNVFYESQKLKIPFAEAKAQIESNINRALLNDRYNPLYNNPYFWYTSTPISGSNHVFSEELQILMAYFHLSNVVRYNPEHLDKLMNSKYWLLISGLRKHGFLRFLKIICSNIRKVSMEID